MKILTILFCLIFSSQTEKSKSYTYYNDTTTVLSFEEIKEKDFLTTQKNNLGLNNGIYWFKIQYPLYLRVNFPLEAYFPIEVSSEAEFTSTDKRNLLGIGFFYGTGLALMIATLVYYFITRNSQFLVFTILIGTIILSVSSKDNILHLFGISFNTLMPIESIGHFAIGITATSFMLFFLNLRPYQLWIKWSMITLSTIAFCAMIFYVITNNDYGYIIVDIASITTLGLMWALFIMIAKGKRKVFLTIVYIINLFVIADICILHHFGIEVLKFNAAGVALISIGNFTLIAILLLISFKRMQLKGVKMKYSIESYIKQLKELNNYKNIQDTNDDYLESLIDQFKLENIEVKVLDEISKGLSTDAIEAKYNLSPERLQNVTNSLYSKLGLEATQDLGDLSI